MRDKYLRTPKTISIDYYTLDELLLTCSHMHGTTQQQFVCSTPLTRHSFSISSFSHDSPLSLLFHWPPLTLPSPSITSEHSQSTHNCTHHCSMEPNTIRTFLGQRKNGKKNLMFLFQKNNVEVCVKTCQNRRTLQTLFI